MTFSEGLKIRKGNIPKSTATEMREYTMGKVWLDERHVVVFESKTNIYSREMNLYTENKEEVYSLYYDERIDDNAARYRCTDMLPVKKGLTVEAEGRVLPVYLRHIVHDPAFDSIFNAQDEELGAVVTETGTTFRVWSPPAENMSVVIDGTLYPMEDKLNGTWELHTDFNLHGAEYFYKAIIHGEIRRILDPYAKALTPNSERGVVYKKDSNNRRAPRPNLTHTQDSTIYELHVRDATIHKDSGVKAKGKYKGLTEKNTKTPNGYSTGLSYIKELGVSHVQLLPLNDFARVDDEQPDKQYNWGYDPLFFQVPEGSYATDVADPFTRIRECREMIDAFHEEGLSVIVDVVYNHVFDMESSPFEQLVPGYYFRYHLDGTVSNGTGVGNDIASERHMVRKFIVETVNYWLEHYQVDGFRFDLMGALDKQTMQLIERRCSEEEIPVLLLGEGWDLPTALASDQKTINTQAGEFPSIRFFNDFFRDTVKGNLFDPHDYGYVNGKGRHIERLPQLVKGSADELELTPPHVSDIVQTVNYAECHDNHTMWDRFEKTNESESEKDRRAIQQLATGLTIVSQGVPFIHAGQEFFRTKLGEGNSYISGDMVNQLDWKRRELFEEHISFVRQLINIRSRFEVFRLRSKEVVRDRLHFLSTPAPVFGFMLLEEGIDIAIYVNPTRRRYQIQLPASGEWRILLSNQQTNPASISGEFTELEPYEFLLAKKTRR